MGNTRMKCSRAEDQAYLGIRSPQPTTAKTPSPVSQVRLFKRDSAISSVKVSGKSSVAEFSVKVGVEVEKEKVENYTKCSKTESIKLLDKQDTSGEAQALTNDLETFKVGSGKLLGLADEMNLDNAIKKCFVRLTKLRNVDVETVLAPPREMLVDSSQGNGENLDDQMVRIMEENVGSKSKGKENIDTNVQVAMSTNNNTFKENDVEIGIVNVNLEIKAKHNVIQRRNVSTEGKVTDKHQNSSVKQKARRLSRKFKSKGKLSSDQDVSKLSSEKTTSNLEAQPESIPMKIPIEIGAEISNEMMTGEDFMAEVNIPEVVVEGMTENAQEIVEKKDSSKAPGNLIEFAFKANLKRSPSNEKAGTNSIEKRTCMDGDEMVGEDSNLNREKSYRISRDVVSMVDALPHSSPKSPDLSSLFHATTPFLVPGQLEEKQITSGLSNLTEKHKQETNLEKERQDNYASEAVDELTETKTAVAPMNENAAVVYGTTCTPNPTIVSEADFLPASPYHSLTRSGGRRRAKRKLSGSKRLKKMKCVKLSFSPTSKSLLPSNSPIVPDTESAVPLPTTIPLPSSPPIAPNLDICSVDYSSAQLSKQDAEKSPLIEEDPIKIDQGLKASLEDDCSSKDVGKQVEATKSAPIDGCDKNEVNKSMKKIRRSSKKWLMSNKSLLLDVDVSESAPEELVSVQVPDKPDIPTYEDVYQRQYAVMNPDGKDTMGDTGKHLKSARRKSKTQVANKNVSSSHASKVNPLFEKDEFPPLIVERKSTCSIKENSLMSTTLTSNKKFFKTSFRQSLDSSIACWREKSFFSGEKKKRKTYTKSFKAKARASGSFKMMDDPYSTSTISHGCPRNENSIISRKTASPTISIPFRDNFVANDLEKEPVGFSSPKPQGVVNKRKPSGIAGNSYPPLLGQSLSAIGNTLDQHPAQVTGKGDNKSEESIIVLSSTLRVLEMIARSSDITTELREIWGAIRSVAESQEKS